MVVGVELVGIDVDETVVESTVCELELGVILVNNSVLVDSKYVELAGSSSGNIVLEILFVLFDPLLDCLVLSVIVVGFVLSDSLIVDLELVCVPKFIADVIIAVDAD